MVGLRYKMGQDVISGQVTVSGSSERLVTIRAEALPGYALIGEGSWSKLYGAGKLQLLSADDFRGAAGDSLIPLDAPVAHGMRYGREMPIVGARRLRWCCGASYKAVPKLAGNNELRSSPGELYAAELEPMTEDTEVEIDVKEWPTSHWAGFSINMAVGARGGGKEIQFLTSGGRLHIRPLQGTVFNMDPSLLGKWKIRRKARILNVTSPTGMTFTYDGTNDADAWGDKIRIIIASSPGGVLRLGDIRVSGVI